MSTIVDHRRRRWTGERVTDIAPEALTGGDPTHDVDDRDLLMSALRRLPMRQRSCVVLRYFDELSVQETAEAVGCTAGTVKSRMVLTMTDGSRETVPVVDGYYAWVRAETPGEGSTAVQRITILGADDEVLAEQTERTCASPAPVGD